MELHSSGVRVPPGYGALLDQCIEVLRADDRVRAAWVHGSLARGDADALSDLDVIVAVADDDVPSYAAEWRDRLRSMTPTLMARASFGDTGSWLAITPTCQRFDMWVEPASRVVDSPVRDRHVLFDRDDLDNVVPPPLPPADPSPETFARLRATFANAVAVAAVADDLLALEVVHALRWALYDAYVETNRPLPTTGLKQWSAKLTDEQRRIFDALPTDGRSGPLIEALASVLGPPPASLPEPNFAAVVIPPEGMVRGLLLATAEPGSWPRHLAEEFLAMYLYVALIAHRQDWLLGIEGLSLRRKLLYELFLQANGYQAAAGPADWSARLTADQRAELLALPTGDATADGVLDASRASRDAFVRQGRAMLGDEWPAEMEHAITRYVDDEVHQVT